MDPGWQALTDDQRTRWREVLGTITATVPSAATAVTVSGPDEQAALFASRLSAHLGALAEPAVRIPTTVRVSEAAPGDFVVWLRVARGADGDGEFGADVVVDLHDVTWPVVRRTVAGADGWYLRESRAFFGTVVGLDLTPQMLAEARRKGRSEQAALLLADARSLPVATGCADVVFAAGLVMHLPDLYAGLLELARVTRTGGRLVLFHPSGRAALAARHGRTLRPEDPLHGDNLRASLHSAGWNLTKYDDPPHRFLALADRA